MPNFANPMGFGVLGRNASGGWPTFKNFNKLVGAGTAIRARDLVARDADGSISRTITPGTTLYSGVAINGGAASTATEHQVTTDPFALFSAQANASLLLADMGLNANAVLGSTQTRYSDDQIAASSAAVTATLDFHLIDQLPDVNGTFGTSVKLIVQFNKPRLAHNVVGV